MLESHGLRFPDWWVRWFELVPTWETVGAQAPAVLLVVGSYFVAEQLKVRAPRRRGRELMRVEPDLG